MVEVLGERRFSLRLPPKMPTASEAREPDAYRVSSNRSLGNTRCGSADKLVVKPCKQPAENESVDDSIEYEQTS